MEPKWEKNIIVSPAGSRAEDSLSMDLVPGLLFGLCFQGHPFKAFSITQLNKEHGATFCSQRLPPQLWQERFLMPEMALGGRFLPGHLP